MWRPVAARGGPGGHDPHRALAKRLRSSSRIEMSSTSSRVAIRVRSRVDQNATVRNCGRQFHRVRDRRRRDRPRRTSALANRPNALCRALQIASRVDPS